MTDTSLNLARTPFDALFDLQVDAAMLVDVTSGRFVRANTAAQMLLGYDQQTLLAMTPSDIHPHELPRLQAFVQNVRSHGTWMADDLSCQRCDGEKFPALVNAALVVDGTTERLLILVRDRREKRLADLGQAVRRLAHDLKNVLATAQLTCDRLGTHRDERVRRSAEAMTRALERAVQLCRETVQVGRARMPAPDRERFLLTDLMEDLEATVAGVGLSGYTLVDESPGTVMLDADFDQIYRCLMNLVRNAFDAGATRVSISGSTDDTDVVTLLVGDNGPGLPEDVAANLGRERTFGGALGSGLGLMIAREICENHGGRLDVSERRADGTVFRLSVPGSG